MARWSRIPCFLGEVVAILLSIVPRMAAEPPVPKDDQFAHEVQLIQQELQYLVSSEPQWTISQAITWYLSLLANTKWPFTVRQTSKRQPWLIGIVPDEEHQEIWIEGHWPGLAQMWNPFRGFVFMPSERQVKHQMAKFTVLLSPDWGCAPQKAVDRLISEFAESAWAQGVHLTRQRPAGPFCIVLVPIEQEKRLRIDAYTADPTTPWKTIESRCPAGGPSARP